MASVNLGRVGLVLRGDWSATTNYVPLDVVTYNGNSFAAKAASINTLPTNTTYWQPLAQNSEYIAQMEEYLAQTQEYAETAEESSEAAAKALANQADVYSNQSTYSAGDYVLYEGVLYRCLNPITAPENWTPANWETIKFGGALPPLQNDTNNLKNDIGTPFSTTADYSSGDFVMYNGILYRFTESHPAGAWTGEDVSQVSIAGDFLPRNAINIDNHTLSIDTDESSNAGNSYLNKVKFNDSEYDIRDSSAAPAIVETATGSPATIPDGADSVPVKSLIAQINPVQEGSGDPSPENIRAITGWTGCTISRSGEDTSNPEEYTIAFPVEAGTVYGGTLDATNGALTVTWKEKIFNGTETLAYNSKDGNYISVTTSAQATDRITTHVICSHLKTQGSGNVQNIIRNRTTANGFSMFFGRTAICDLDTSAFIALSNAEKVALVNTYMTAQYEAGTPVTVVYRLMEPVTYQVSPTEVTTILGVNNIWADTGNVTVQYRADTKTYVDSSNATLKDFGAVGDGVTDDTAAIQRALTACAGKTLNVTAGTYLFSQTLNIFSGTHVIGGGMASKFKLADTFSLTPYPWRTGDPLVADQYRYPMIYMDTDTDGIILENFAVEGQTTAFYDKNFDCLTIRGSNHVARNLVIKKINFFPSDFSGRTNNGVGRGINVQDASTVFVENCAIDDCGYECIGVENADNVTIQNCICTHALQVTGQIHRNATNIRMIGNTFDNTDRQHTGSSSAGPGFTLHAATTTPMNDILIEGNLIKNAFVFANGGGENSVKIINNRMAGISLNAVDAWRDKCVVMGNTIMGQLNLKSDNAIIAGNMVYHTGGGYMISASGNNVVCYGNIPLNSTTKGVRIVNHDGTSATASTMQEYAVGPDGSIDTSGTFTYNGNGIVYND